MKVNIPAGGGGKKQAWINANLGLIVMLNDSVGPEKTCEICGMKPDTLISALRRAEDKSRPAITRADRAKIEADKANVKADTALRELAAQAEFLGQVSGEVQELKGNLTCYFALMEQANGLMSRLCQATQNTSVESTSYFTERIGSAGNNKVGQTVSSSRARLFNYRRPVRQITGPKNRVEKKHHRGRQVVKRRWRDV